MFLSVCCFGKKKKVWNESTAWQRLVSCEAARELEGHADAVWDALAPFSSLFLPSFHLALHAVLCSHLAETHSISKIAFISNGGTPLHGWGVMPSGKCSALYGSSNFLRFPGHTTNPPTWLLLFTHSTFHGISIQTFARCNIHCVSLDQRASFVFHLSSTPRWFYVHFCFLFFGGFFCCF